MSYDLELWTREDRDLAPLLPRAGAWDDVGDEWQYDGDGWLINVAAPEEDDEVPDDLSALAGGLRYRIGIGVEGSPSPETWALVREILNAVGGAAIDPESGHSRVWPT